MYTCRVVLMNRYDSKLEAALAGLQFLLQSTRLKSSLWLEQLTKITYNNSQMTTVHYKLVQTDIWI